MTASSQSSPEEWDSDIPDLPARFQCQTCGVMPVRLITVDLEDQSTTDMECMGCCLARWMAIIKALAQDEETANIVAHHAPPG